MNLKGHESRLQPDRGAWEDVYDALTSKRVYKSALATPSRVR